ncbi:hypothetical protein [Moritella viscosa]|uniref:Uncharacterized protein n=1 Tax=Moritella viscosa TaxID=80854 RepID=A0A1L0ARJ6_9GAMM|nr:hypothetical protein [Moritella viscosa]SGZ20286.1 Putative uncharacterized protein [Moritella viscosa]
MPNTFDLNKMNHALYVANVDNVQLDKDGYKCAQSVADEGFSVMGKFCWEHGRLPDKDFGTINKGEILGMLIDDMSDEVLQKIN